MSIEALFPSLLTGSTVADEPAHRPPQDPAARDAYDLETAVIFSRLDDLRALLERGVSATTPDHEGYLLLSFAVANSRIEVIRQLLAHGADPLKVDSGGLCPLELADVLGHDEALDVLLDHLGVEARPLEAQAA